MKTLLTLRRPTSAERRSANFTITTASLADREEIYRARHDVYARELGQRETNGAARLTDELDEHNVYLVARVGDEMAGFISITPPAAGIYSIDKYFPRPALPFAIDDRLHEIRLLTVLRAHRGGELATLLMYAAFRWVEARAGERVVAIGRREILDMYLKTGLQLVGQSVQSGAVTYDLLHATIPQIRSSLERFSGLISRLEEKTEWRLPFAFDKPASCFHGGAFFEAIGERFDALERKDSIINADVLDAWFPPSPKPIAALQTHLPWLMRTSPPTTCAGLIEAIAEARGVSPANILPGGGSSDLIFRAFRHWLTPKSHALILDPTYGEYAHVLEQVIGCTVDRFPVRREENYDLDLDRLRHALGAGYDLVVIVNPNSPTGRHTPRSVLEDVLRGVPQRTRVWVDETYVEYAGRDQSIEKFAAQSENILVCKSMSKVYALSGLRAAYLCASAHQLESLRAITPPWVVGLPAQVAATMAVADGEYYQARYSETHHLRAELARRLNHFGWEIVPGIANFLLCQLPDDGPNAAQFVQACRQRGLFIRNAALMGSGLGGRALRIAVKDAETNQRMVRIIRESRTHLQQADPSALGM